MVDPRRDPGRGRASRAGPRGIFLIKDRWKPQIPPDPRVVSEDRDGGAWLPLHYRELEALSDRWQPYVYFRQRPFPGQTITVRADGSRATWQPPPSQGDDERAKPLKILMLGGSSLWGFGSRDEQTIPSLIARTPRARCPRRDQEPGGDRLCQHARSDRALPRASTRISTRSRSLLRRCQRHDLGLAGKDSRR